MENLSKLLHEKELLESRIQKLFHGSIEIRQQKSKNYIYVHFRDNGISRSKYVGEYSVELYNLILENNNLVKEYKKKLKSIKKELTSFQYVKENLKDKVKINIDLARRNMVDSIYKQAKLEGVATTYSETETIVYGGVVNGISSSDITKVINLKHAWEFILNEGVITYPTNFLILCQINEIVEEGFSYLAGKLRSVPVRIGGTSYLPPMPYEAKIKHDLINILNQEEGYNVAIDLVLYVMKQQPFVDGNKRTAVLFANHYLISKGLGLIVIPAELVSTFKQYLLNYYDNNDESIKAFLYEQCLLKI